MNQATLRSRARQDVLEQHDWYVAQEAHRAAKGFVDAVAATVSLLLDAPSAGRLEAFAHPRLRGLRSIGTNGYPSIRLYYFVAEEGIDVIRVLHAAQDVSRIIRSEL